MEKNNHKPLHNFLAPVFLQATAIITAALEKVDGNLSPNGRKAWFLLATTACSILCICMIVKGLNGKALKTHPPGHIKTTMIATGTRYSAGLESGHGYEETRRLIKYLDSLKNDPSGSATYRALMTASPGLLDSLSVLQSYYQTKLSTYGKNN